MLLIFVDVDELKKKVTQTYTRHKKASYTYQFPPIHPNNYHIYLKEKQNNPLRCADDVCACHPAAPTGRARETEAPTTKQTPRAWIRNRAMIIQPHIRKWADVNLSSGVHFPPTSVRLNATREASSPLNTG